MELSSALSTFGVLVASYALIAFVYRKSVSSHYHGSILSEIPRMFQDLRVIPLLIIITLVTPLTKFQSQILPPPQACNGIESVQEPIGDVPSWKGKIAIVSTWVWVGEGGMYKPEYGHRVKRTDHLINKECYAHLHGYDYIFNQTWGFAEDRTAKHLNYGTWHRVPHIRAAMDTHEWVLFADIDYVFKDLARPLESLLKEFEIHGIDVSLIVPGTLDNDSSEKYTFSAFAIMVRNSDFGRSVMDFWDEFADGLCPKGNFKPLNGESEYDWSRSDQPGLWYAMVRAHQKARGIDTSYIQCTDEGYIDVEQLKYLNEYFESQNMKIGSYGLDLKDMPQNQSIIWTQNREGSRPGLAVQCAYGHCQEGKKAAAMLPFAFATHFKEEWDWPEVMKYELQKCKDVFQCFAGYDNDTFVKGCKGRERK